MSPTLLAQTRDVTGEGIVWHEDEQAVYWVDINRFLVHRYHIHAKECRDWLFTEPVVALSLTTRPGTLLVALASKLICWQPATDSRTDQGFCLPNAPDFRLNDGRPDPCGNLWVGSMKERIGPNGEPGEVTEWEGALYRITPKGEATVWKRGLGIPNTLCWSPDGTRFYFGDSERKTLWEYKFDAATGAIADEQVFFHYDEDGVPDGSAMDAEGHLWNCRYGGGCLLRISPNGRVVQRVEMPVQNPTTCTFGGPVRTALFITTAHKGDEANPLAGSLFSLQTQVPGLPENRFRLPL